MFLGRRLLHFLFLFFVSWECGGFFVWMGELTTTTYRVMDMKRPIRRSEKPSSAKNNAVVVGRKKYIISFSRSFSLFFSYDTKQKNEMQISLISHSRYQPNKYN